MDMNHTWLAIIAGGQGTRLFPYSHPERPRQFCQLNEQNKFIQEVVKNFVNLGIKPTNIVVVTTNDNQSRLAIEQTLPRGVLSQNILQISQEAGYTNAMIEASRFIYEHDNKATVINTPSDQFIVADEDFRRTIFDAVQTAEGGSPVIVGVKINDLTTAMGCGHAFYQETSETCHPFTSFVEKPNKEYADLIMRTGNSACNTGINVWRADTVLNPVPLTMAKNQGTAEFMLQLSGRAKEKNKNLMVAVGTFEWYDCGTLKSLYDISKKTPNHRNASLGGGQIDRFECLDGLFLCDEGYRLHAVGCVGDAVIVSTIENRPIVAVINKAESARVKKLAEDFSHNRDLLVNDFSIMAHNNFVMRSNISNDTIVCFVCVENYIVGTHRAEDGSIDVYVSKQRS